MIRSRLSVLMAERNERQDDLSRATGISKATLSNIANNKTAGIQYDTLESLAMYFNVGISNLFEYSPLRIEFTKAVDYFEKNITYNEEQAEDVLTMDDFFEKPSSYYLGITYTITGNSLRKTVGDLFISVYTGDFRSPYPTIINNYTCIIEASFGIPQHEKSSVMSKIEELSAAFKKQILDDFQLFLNENLVDIFKADGLEGPALVILGSPSYQFVLNLS